MEDLNNKGNEELKGILKSLEIEHEAIRTEIQKKFNVLDKIENDFEKVKRVLKNRLNL
jgi:hypothetical protein